MESHRSLPQALRSLGIAEESGVIPRLPFTRREGQAISRLVPASRQLKALGFQANRQQASAEELAPYRMLHFATHGLADSVNPGDEKESSSYARLGTKFGDNKENAAIR